MNKRDHQWLRMFSLRWAELFASLSDAERQEVISEPEGHQAMWINRNAGYFAAACLKLRQAKKGAAK